MKKKLSVLFVCFVLLFTSAVPVYASEYNTGNITTENVQFTTSEVNPLYEDVASAEEVSFISDDWDMATFFTGKTYTTVEEAGEYLREQMVARATTVVVSYQTENDDWETLTSDIFNIALEHTGNPCEGDYLKFQYQNYGCVVEGTSDGVTNTAMLTYSINYYTNADQEIEVSNKVAEVIESLNLDGKSEYEKIKAIYDYVCENVSYDYTNLDDDTYLLKYTAYAALIDGTSVCQGYSNLMYRLLLEAGIDTRIIAGVSNNENHSWNIVKFGDVYYNVDATWDSEASVEYNYFLKNESDFTGHTRNDAYLIESFFVLYPMSVTSYSEETIKDESFEIITEDFTYLISDGVATVAKYTGSAADVVIPTEVEGYPVKVIGSQLFYDVDTIKSLVFSEGIETLSSESIFECSELESIYFPSTMRLGDLGTMGLSVMPVFCPKVTRISVAENNPYVSVDDGILYNKDKTVLLYYPAGDKRDILTIPEGVLQIANGACRDNEYLKEVIMPDTVKYIGYWAFSGVSSLEKVTISNNCEVIGQFAFSSTNIKELYIPASVNVLMMQYSHLPELKSIVVDSANTSYYSLDGVLYSEDVLLYYPSNKSGTEYFVPDDITKIGTTAFYFSKNLEKVILPDTVEWISENAFFGCDKIMQMNIPDSVTYIGASAFIATDSQAGLISITIPKSVTSIADSICYDDVIIYGETGSAAEEYAAKRGNIFNDINGPEINGKCGDDITWTLGRDGTLTISGIGEMYNYEYEKSPWFELHDAILKIEIEDGITTVGDYTFEYLRNLSEIEIPKSVINISEKAFVFYTNAEPFVIKGDKDSYAEQYAINNNIDFIAWCDNHVEKIIPAIEAKCTSDGSTEGKICSVCGKVLKKTITINALGHKAAVQGAETATCTAEGYTGDKVCTVCETTVEKGSVIGKIAHTVVTDKEVAATCTTAGKTEGSHCSVCNTVIKAQTTVAALDHKWDAGKITTEATPDKAGMKTYACESCGETKTESVPYTGTVTETIDVSRISGKTRYETAYKTADALKESLGVDRFDTVVIATGENFPDALSGSYLAYVKNAPIILSKDGEDGATVKAYLDKNLKSNGTVYLLGGEGAISKDLENKLSDYKVKRLSGKTRYETNIAILKESNVKAEDILVCTGTNYADSLSASASKKPILLVGDTLSDVQKTYLSQLSSKKYYIIGGTGAVKQTVENSVKAYGTTTRLGGKTRYETSILVAKEFVKNPEAAVVAYGENFPDGLCGGALAVSMNAPLILSRNGAETPAVNYLNNYTVKNGIVLGGTKLVSDDTAKKIFGLGTDEHIHY